MSASTSSSIVTPNHVHFPVAQAFVDAGLPRRLRQAAGAHAASRPMRWSRPCAQRGTVFGVTYNYTGYPHGAARPRDGAPGQLGELRKVVVEYSQGWLASLLEAAPTSRPTGAPTPRARGVAGAMGDIGSHAENLAATITGLARRRSLCADLRARSCRAACSTTTAAVLLRLEGGVRGLLIASQIEHGHENDLRLRVSGTMGTLAWHQEEPNLLAAPAARRPQARADARRTPGCAKRRNARRGCPPGTPEGYHRGLCQCLSRAWQRDIRARRAGPAGRPARAADFPRVEDGARGVRFIERTVASAKSELKWTPW